MTIMPQNALDSEHMNFDGEQFVLKCTNTEKLKFREKQLAEYESRTLSKLSHPNIIKQFSSFQENGSFYIMQEYADCSTLRALMMRQLNLKEKHIMKIMLQLLFALKYLHEFQNDQGALGIIHRDVKPDNVFFKNQELKLGDFGSSIMLNLLTTKSNQQVGTPGFMSPQVLSSSAYTQKADIWSLGCTMFSLITNQPAFPAGADQGERVRTGSFNTSATFPPSLSSQIFDLTTSMLRVDEDQRPSAAEILNEHFVMRWAGDVFAPTDLTAAVNADYQQRVQKLQQTSPGKSLESPAQRAKREREEHEQRQREAAAERRQQIIARSRAIASELSPPKLEPAKVMGEKSVQFNSITDSYEPEADGKMSQLGPKSGWGEKSVQFKTDDLNEKELLQKQKQLVTSQSQVQVEAPSATALLRMRELEIRISRLQDEANDVQSHAVSFMGQKSSFYSQSEAARLRQEEIMRSRISDGAHSWAQPVEQHEGKIESNPMLLSQQDESEQEKLQMQKLEQELERTKTETASFGVSRNRIENPELSRLKDVQRSAKAQLERCRQLARSFGVENLGK